MNVDLYSYEPLAGCHWDHISAAEASEILSHKKLALAGDSHMRNFATHLVKWACDIDDAFSKGLYTYFTVKNETGTKCMGMSFSYSPDYFCSKKSFTWQNWKEDFILVNCGHHPASEDHWSLDRYQRTIETYVKNADASTSGVTQKNFIWMESNPQPFRNDSWVVQFKDWRTQHRLLLFNEVANSIFLSHNYTVMYNFQSLLPFVESICDGAHFIATGTLYPQFLQFLHIIKSKS